MRSPFIFRALRAGFLVLLLNSAYIASSAAPSLFFYSNVAVHVLLGVAVAIGALIYWIRARPRVSGSTFLLALLFFGTAGAGVWLASVGATRSHQRVIDVHRGLAIAAALALAAWSVSYAMGALTARGRRLALTAAALLVLGVALPVAIKAVAKRQWPDQYRIVNPLVPPLAMDNEGAGRTSPFFPSSANTNVGRTIPSNFFMTSTTCGRCHKDIYDQWNSSAHHFSSFNNQWYRKSIEYMQDVVGTQPSKWCAGCHDHAVFFNGRFDRPIKEQIDTPEAQAGLACTSCHSIVHVGSTMGQGDFTIEYPPLHDLAASENPLLRARARRADLSGAGAASQHVPQAVSSRADRGVLFALPQGAPRRAGERLSLVPRLQRLRQLAGLGRLGPGRALVLLPAEVAAVRRLPHAARRRRTIRRRRTARCGRTASPARTRRCRSSTTIRCS